MAESKNLLTKSLETRVKNPPLVILMSRSENLEAKRDEFRDDVGLIDSGFRILRKAELEEGSNSTCSWSGSPGTRERHSGWRGSSPR